jgi:hypothetical protein
MNMANSVIPSILSVVISLALAFGIDKWLLRIERYARKESRFNILTLWWIITGIILILIWGVLTWVVLEESHRNKLVSFVFIVLGIIAIVWYPLPRLIPNRLLLLLLIQFRPINFEYTGLLIAALRILTLLPNHQKAS